MEPNKSQPNVVTNADLYARMERLEQKVDDIFVRMDQALGGWMVVKILGSIIFGVVVISNAIYSIFHHSP